MILRIFALLLILVSSSASAETGALSVKEVVVSCSPSQGCEDKKLRFANLKGDYRSIVHLKDTLRLVNSDGGYQSLSYKLYDIDGSHRLEIDLVLKPVIREINIGFTDRILELDPNQLLSVHEGEYFESQKLKASLDGLKARLESLGFPDSKHELEVSEIDQNVRITVTISLGKPLVFKRIQTSAKSAFIRDFLEKKFIALYDKPFELTKFKLSLDEAQKELFSYGYYLLSLDFTPVRKGYRVNLDIKVNSEGLYAFDVDGLKREDHSSILALLKDLFRKFKRPVPHTSITSAIDDHYKKLALLNVNSKVRVSQHLNMYKEKVTVYHISLKENEKTRLSEVSFQGNRFFTEKKLKEMFQKEAFELASINYYDREYFDYFVGYLKNQYIKNGFVQTNIQGPEVTLDAQKKEAQVQYVIIEGQRAFVREITFDGLPSEFEAQVLNEMKNKTGQPFDPIAFVDDLKKVSTLLQNQGYYFAEIENATDENLVLYSKVGTDVSINIRVNPGPVIRLNKIIYLGNYKTQKRVLSKKITLKKNDLITPARTREIESVLSATGLFNTVSATPLKHSSKNPTTDLVIRLAERDYGLIEFAPGFRTDLGLKLTGTASYTNIGGMNRALTLRGQVNQRLSNQILDSRRSQEDKKILEHNVSMTFTQGDIFDSRVDYSATISDQRKRFYSFDADIYRLTNTFTRDFSKSFSSSLRYQYETIYQYDATEEKDKGSFRIGSITPSLTYDLRNSQINTTKGAFFNISTEFANPFLLSQDSDDLKINYYKLISRNRFYIPFKNGTVAISMVGGIQENLSKEVIQEDGQPVVVSDADGKTYQRTKGVIPTFKVFRLTGMDNVRGYSDVEINKGLNNRDISETRVQNKAYLANFKLEPRYFINDALMAGIFFDAGRVYVDQVDLGDIRTSTGITLKILTPVGTLDFDYGIKLLRKRNANGSMEDPGRFHVSIGFF